MKCKGKAKRFISLFLALIVLLTCMTGINGDMERVEASPADYSLGIHSANSSYYEIIYKEWFKDGYITIDIGEPRKYGDDFSSNEEFEKYLIENPVNVFKIDKNQIDKKFSDEGKIPKYVVVGSEIHEYGKKFTISEEDFKLYGDGKNLDLNITYDGEYQDCWLNGNYIDSNGNNSYKAKAKWYGSNGSYWFQDSSGWYPVSSWQKIINLNDYESTTDWRYFDENGYVACNGWYKINGSWYYFDDKCCYEYFAWRDGYYIDADGVQRYEYIGSWKSDSNGWWYSDTSGWYPTNQAEIIDGIMYYFKSDGYMACNEWIEENYLVTDLLNEYSYHPWSHYDSNGQMDKVGYYDVDGNWVESVIE